MQNAFIPDMILMEEVEQSVGFKVPVSSILFFVASVCAHLSCSLLEGLAALVVWRVESKSQAWRFD